VAVFLDEDGLVPALEQVARPAVTFIEQLRIDAGHLPHANRQVALRGLYEQMIVICHEAIGMTGPVVTRIGMLEGIEEVLAVRVIPEDGFFSLPRDVT
jgi:hypothetical protein